MSSHDCAVRGNINVRDGITDSQVRAAIQPFLIKDGRSDFDEQVTEGNIEFDGSALSFSLNFYGYGGYQSDAVDMLVQQLETIVDGHAYIEVMDFDTGDLDAACCPQFIATDEVGRQAARLEYGILQMTDYVVPVVGKEAFETLRKHILTLPRE